MAALWRRIADEIREQILDGRLPVGTKLPTTQEYAELYGHSASTIARAMDHLTAAGLVDAQQGGRRYVAAGVSVRGGARAKFRTKV